MSRARKGLAERILAELCGGPLTAAQIAERLREPTRAVSSTLASLCSEGQCRQDGQEQSPRSKGRITRWASVRYEGCELERAWPLPIYREARAS